MRKVVTILIAALLGIVGGAAAEQQEKERLKEYDTCMDALLDAYKIERIIEGKSEIFGVEDSVFQSIQNELRKLFRGKTYQMPALAVSFHEMTVREMEKGIWLKFFYPEQRKCFGMEFTALLFRVQEGHHGIDVIREYNDIYTGRCYHINFDKKDTTALYQKLGGDGHNAADTAYSPDAE